MLTGAPRILVKNTTKRNYYHKRKLFLTKRDIFAETKTIF